MTDEPGDELILREEFTTTMPVLSVHFDFNDLLTDYDEAKAFDIVGKLKDLLA
jgi:hypothetical protein